MLKFRRLQHADLASDAWSSQSELKAAFRSAFPEDTVFGAFLDDVPVGALVLSANSTESKPPCALLKYLYVRSDCRRQGIGRILTAIAAGEAAERQLWFLAAPVPETSDAAAFAKAIHFGENDWMNGLLVLDLSDVEGLRYG